MTATCVVIGNATLYCGWCEDIVPTLTGIDAIVTDPPYGHGWRGIESEALGGGNWGRRRSEAIKGHDVPFDPALLLSLKVPTILWGANHYADRLPASPAWLCWDKREGTTENNLSDCELAWTNVGGSARLFRHLWNGLSMKPGSEETRRTPDGKAFPRLHPLQKPLALMEWCISKLNLPKGAKVLDAYMGSCTTGVACHRLGLEFVGIDVDPRHFNTSCTRLRAEHAQQRLFV